jgi:hypothetical protein
VLYALVGVVRYDNIMTSKHVEIARADYSPRTACARRVKHMSNESKNTLLCEE